MLPGGARSSRRGRVVRALGARDAAAEGHRRMAALARAPFARTHARIDPAPAHRAPASVRACAFFWCRGPCRTERNGAAWLTWRWRGLGAAWAWAKCAGRSRPLRCRTERHSTVHRDACRRMSACGSAQLATAHARAPALPDGTEGRTHDPRPPPTARRRSRDLRPAAHAAAPRRLAADRARRRAAEIPQNLHVRRPGGAAHALSG
jgi:hypothetical protein